MKAQTHYLWFNTKSRQEILDVTDEVVEQVRTSGVQEGFVLVSAMHITTCTRYDAVWRGVSCTTGAFSLARSAARSWLDRSDSTRPSRSQSSSHVPTTVYETPACSVKVNDSDSSVSSVPTRSANDRAAALVPSDAVARSSWART